MDTRENPYRALPSVDELLRSPASELLLARFGREPLLAALRSELDAARVAIAAEPLGPGDVAARWSASVLVARAETALAARFARTHVAAVNATGVVLHTGLGRAPMSDAAREAVAEACRYAVVEVDRATGERNHREAAVASLLRELTGAPAATVVNNNAAATLLSLAALAAGRGVVVSRGQLVEIGGSYRIPDVMEQSGCRLVEVGTTNKTHLADYERAIAKAGHDVGLILRVHPSNFRIVGFTSEVALEELVALGARTGLPVMDDLGSGCLVDLGAYGLGGEPLVQESLALGAAVATFSGDKLLGGPQAGLIVGLGPEVARIRAHPLFRAVRPDKLTLAALEATLQLYRDPAVAVRVVPVLRMIATPAAALEPRARALAAAAARHPQAWEVSVRDEESMVGGGSYAVERLPTRVVALAPRKGGAQALAKALRLATPPVFARIADERVLLDPRTIDPREDPLVSAALDTIARRVLES